MRTVRCAAAAAAVALVISCSSSSTGPGDPFAGTWAISWHGVTQTQTVTPSPWLVTVTKSGTGYTARYPTLTWAYNGAGGTIDTYSATADSSWITFRSDSLLLQTQDSIALNCKLELAGAIQGDSVVLGLAGANGVMCVPGAWTWSAKKQ